MLKALSFTEPPPSGGFSTYKKPPCSSTGGFLYGPVANSALPLGREYLQTCPQKAQGKTFQLDMTPNIIHKNL